MNTIAQRPLTSTDPLEILNRALLMYRQVCDLWRPIDLKRLQNYEMVIGKQWPKQDYEYLMSNRRSADVINFILPVVLALSGTQKANRQKLRAFPVSGGDDERAAILTHAMRWSFNQCDKEFQFSRAFVDAVIGRWGWMKSYWSTENDVEGLWYTDWHDPMRIKVDPETQGDFHRTCNYLFDSTWMTGEAIINTFAANDEEKARAMQEQIDLLEARESNLDRPWSWRDKFNLMYNVARALFGAERELSELVSGEWLDVRNGLYRVVELHEKRYLRQKYFLDTMSGHTTLMPKEVRDNRELIRLALEYNPQLTVHTRHDCLHYVTTLVPAWTANPFAAVAQDAPYEIQNGMYVYSPVTCYDFHPDISETRSVVDALRDPQQSYNKLESTLRDFIVRFVGHGWTYEEGAIAPDDKKDWESREVGINRKYQKGYQPPQPDVPPQLPREVIIGRTDHRESIRAISGVPLNYSGETQTKNEASSLFAQRVQQAGLMQSTLMDALKRTDRWLGKQAIDGLQHYLRSERWLRIVEDDADPFWLVVNQKTLAGVVNDLSVGRYDVELDTSTYSATARQEGFLQSLAVAKMMPPDLIPWHLVVRNSDIPDKQAWMQYINTRMGLDQVISQLLQQATAGRNAGALPAGEGSSDKASALVA